MKLRSGKVLIKNLNNSSSSRSNEIIEDFPTRLPNSVLMQILTMLPDEDVNRMRILSHTWNNKDDVWPFLPNLHFVMPVCRSQIQENQFHDTVEQTLVRRGNLPIQKLFLDCSWKCDYERVYNWLRSAVEIKVQELDLRFPDDRYKVRFCWDLFETCTMLVTLTLNGEFTLDVPKAKLLFPCLKKVNLISIVYSDSHSFTNLISGCPSLEELFVERNISNDNLEIFKVSSTSLKRLRISFTLRLPRPHITLIDTPNLEYLHLVDYMSIVYSFTKPGSLAEAHIESYRFDAQLFLRLSSAKVLTLSYASLRSLVDTVHGINEPMFPNVIKLVTGVGFFSHWDVLLTVLNHMPNCEHITLDCHLRSLSVIDNSWSPPVVAVPSCLSSKVKEIIILNETAIHLERKVNFIRFLLENSNSLETFRVNVCDFHKRWRDALMNIHCGSSLCKVELV